MRDIDLLQSRVNKALLTMSSPMSLERLSTFLFQVIDTYLLEIGLTITASKVQKCNTDIILCLLK